MLDASFELAPRGRGETLRALAALLEALTQIDEGQVDELPPLLESGVRYVFDGSRDDCGSQRDKWRDARTVYRLRAGDCEDVATWLAAELRRRGDTGARAVPFYVSGRLVHVVVVAGDGSIMDPSIALGMPRPPGLTVDSMASAVAGALIEIGR